MNPAALNLIGFFALVALLWLAIRLITRKNILHTKTRQQKTLTEDILKQLYHVEQSQRSATLSDLSGALKVRRSKILPVIEAMAASGLIQTSDDRLQLTPAGREYALKIVRVHRLWEKYLAEKTGHQPSEWHHLAEKMEHRLDEAAISNLSASLGNPLFDPHGDPIPSAKGEVLPVKWQPLPSYPENVPGKIVHIEDEPGVIYQQILARRILVGSHVKIRKSTAREIVFTCEGHQHRLSPIVAANISVGPLATEEHYQENAIRLSALREGEQARVIGISQECRGASRRRLLDLGILPGTTVEVDFTSPLQDPVAYKIRNTTIALRQDLADLILIKKTNTHAYAG